MLDPVSWQSNDGKTVRSYSHELDDQGGKLRLIDQTLLPEQLVYVELNDTEDIFDAIKRLVVRGAPAIGCAAALGLAAIVRKVEFCCSKELASFAQKNADRLAESRPTAVNLFWALNLCMNKIKENTTVSPEELKNILLKTALGILEEDIQMCRSIGTHGKTLLKDGMGSFNALQRRSLGDRRLRNRAFPDVCRA